MGIFEPEDNECWKKPKVNYGLTRVDYLEEAHKREREMQQRMFDEADKARIAYQKLNLEHTKLQVEHKYSLNEISLLRRLVRALYDHDREEENIVRKEMEKEYVNFR